MDDDAHLCYAFDGPGDGHDAVVGARDGVSDVDADVDLLFEL